MVYIIMQLKYGNMDQIYFRILVTPDCKFDLKRSAA